MDDGQRRRELTDFLRTRRARLSPEAMGLPNGNRRRTPGLRREEVAQLANVSTTWYTFLEQGRDIRVSAQVLESLVRALQLTPAERAHLFLLALQQSPPHLTQQPEIVSPALQRLLASFDTGPAYITGRRWDVLAWNAAAPILLGNLDAMPVRERNIIWLFFTNLELRRSLVNWEEHAQFMLAKFRCACSRYIGDEAFVELIEDLQKTSPEFQQWWPRHDIKGRCEGLKEYEHPIVGRLMFEYTTFLVEGTPDLRFVIHTPQLNSGTAEKFQQLKQLHQKMHLVL
ncbi:helix-turn-helix transcriptional regulator [Leptolyngbya sp. FACHB-261]|uniref:helix-turn-helix transcriptional regulator n=1 Tax=Leptolyngbya sp. FACHB-261 TaxID=2692806 RepID=UPI00168571DD|nr:helix-turn-helix transcriptional regulator [Leptolyngbya sp. FACHB-261]MBD2099479.1 helix-turn-helix domain-containing protein [Leptolyngbya sp. FACHB-261]